MALNRAYDDVETDSECVPVCRIKALVITIMHSDPLIVFTAVALLIFYAGIGGCILSMKGKLL